MDGNTEYVRLSLLILSGFHRCVLFVSYTALYRRMSPPLLANPATSPENVFVQARPKYQKEVRNYYGTTPLTRRHRPAVRSRSEKFNRRHNDSDNIKLLQYWEPQAATLLANKNGAPSGGESRTAVNVWFLEPHELRAPNGLSIGSVILQDSRS